MNYQRILALMMHIEGPQWEQIGGYPETRFRRSSKAL
jgi:hypothetical protein